MAWQAAYDAYGAEPVIRQMLAIINRDVQAALDFVSGDPASLAPFSSYQLAEHPAMNYPVLLMMPQYQQFDEETEHVAQQRVPIFCAVAAEHQDPNQVAVLVQRYAMAVWHVLTAAWQRTPRDFAEAGLALPASAYGPGQLTAGVAAGKLNFVFVGRPAYAELRRSASSNYVKAASLSIECDLSET